MVATHSSKRPRAPRNPAPEHDETAPRPPAAVGDPAPTNLPPACEAAINAERRNLQKAASILGCLVAALEYGYDGERNEEPDYADVARAVRSMIASSITQLDPTNLRHVAAQPTESPE